MKRTTLIFALDSLYHLRFDVRKRLKWKPSQTIPSGSDIQRKCGIFWPYLDFRVNIIWTRDLLMNGDEILHIHLRTHFYSEKYRRYSSVPVLMHILNNSVPRAGRAGVGSGIKYTLPTPCNWASEWAGVHWCPDRGRPGEFKTISVPCFHFQSYLTVLLAIAC